MNKFIIFLSIITTFLFISACGEDKEQIDLSADDLINHGWIEYSAGNFESAIYRHQSALNMDAEKSEAFNGIGWAFIKLGKINDSIDSFKKAVTKDPNNADAHAGLAGAYFTAGSYELAIASALKALSINQNYESPHDPIKANNLRILLAESYYNMGNYASAKSQIEMIGTYGKTLDPSSPNYKNDLLLAIDELARKN